MAGLGPVEEELVIVRRRPYRRLFTVVLFLVGSLGMTGAAYFAGGWQSQQMLRVITVERDSLGQRLLMIRNQLSESQQRVAVLETASSVDREASEQVRSTVRNLNDEIADLKQEVSFYKGIMAPGSEDKGLRISKISLSPMQENGQYNYSVMLTQVSDNSRFVDGIVAINIIGEQASEPAVLELREVDSDISELGVRFRFRYFQEIKGQLSLPPEFRADKFQVVLQTSGRRQQKVSQVLAWDEAVVIPG